MKKNKKTASKMIFLKKGSNGQKRIYKHLFGWICNPAAVHGGNYIPV
jgi:hypothetical protein